MRKNLTQLITALLFLALAVGVQAMEHGAADHNAMAGMDMGGDQIMLPAATVKGVKGSAHLLDTSKAMAQAGMAMTHHLMITFTDVATGKPMGTGVVAVKVVDPAGKKTAAMKMMAMEESFGADVALSQKGKYVFEVGTKLGNGENRQFLFEYLVK
jgi:hypothetical protein